MAARFRNWLDQRTGYRRLIEILLLERIPGGARWRYVWGSCLLFVFGVQLLTGLLLMTAYSPGDSTAWGSVYFIQYEMDFGWLIRGLHHFGSQAMVVLLGIHMLQVVIAGAQLPPREVNWWLGLGLLATVLALSLTGYLLPWDQKGYWATMVATNIAGNLPGIGPWLQKTVVGGPVYGHHTLTRFFTLHVGILPPLLVVLTIAHLTVFRRHGVTVPLATIPLDEKGEPLPAKGDGWFWPDQAFRDLVVSMVIFGILLGLVLWGHGHKLEPSAAPADATGAAEPGLYERWAHAGRDGRGANLDAPADPSRPYPARPEWYFLFLFQLLKYFEGPNEILGTVIIPQAVLLVLALLPLLGYGRMRPFGRVVGIAIVVLLLGSVITLTGLALAADRANTPAARTFRDEVEKAERLGERAVQLAHDGIPAEGPVVLLRRDPLTRGKELFGEHCAVCHTYGNAFPNDRPAASDLEGFGTKAWIAGLLRDPAGPHYFGPTRLRTMSNWVKRTRKSAERKGQDAQFDAELDQIAEWLAGHPRAAIPDERQKGSFAEGYRAFAKHCGSCHTYNEQGGEENVTAPDLTGYGDEDWLRLMIMAPASESRYGLHNTMPAFRDLEGPTAAVTKREFERIKKLLQEQISGEDSKAARQKKALEEASRLVHLSAIDRELIVRWLLKDYRVVFGGEPIAAAPKY